MNKKLKKLCNRIYEHNNFDTNAICCIEEMSELTKVLSKFLRNSSKKSHANLIEELSHVLLMCNTFIYIFAFDEKEVYNIQLNAVERMEGKVTNGNKK